MLSTSYSLHPSYHFNEKYWVTPHLNIRIERQKKPEKPNPQPIKPKTKRQNDRVKILSSIKTFLRDNSPVPNRKTRTHNSPSPKNNRFCLTDIHSNKEKRHQPKHDEVFPYHFSSRYKLITTNSLRNVSVSNKLGREVITKWFFGMNRMIKKEKEMR
jgi:hypothetical protein